MRTLARRRAMTLIELILVLGLLATLLAIAAPSLGGFFRGRAVENEARRLLGLARYARTQAVSLGVPMELAFETQTGRCGAFPAAGYQVEEKMPVEFHLPEGPALEAVEKGKLEPSEGNPSSRLSRSLGDSRLSDMLHAKGKTEVPGVVRISFLPDGRLAEKSPQALVLRDDRDGAVRFVRNALNTGYRIQEEAAGEIEILSEESAGEVSRLSQQLGRL